MSEVEFEVRVDWHGVEVAEKDHRAARRGLKLAMEHLLQVANDYVPIEEGTLMRSGTASVDDESLTGAVSYSAYNTQDDYDYAVRQHEDLTLHHAPGRKAKWLEESAWDEEHTMAEIIAEQIRRANES